MRQIERIEESFLRQILKTSKGCPITQLYLEIGQVPARFEIQKMRLLFLKYILQQNEDSTLYKLFKLQLEAPSRGDWASTCLEDLKEFRITESMEEIKLMTKKKFNSILKERVTENGIKYLKEKQGKKGKEINYSGLNMAEYLSPNNEELSVDKKRKMFAVRNRMVDIPANFPKPNVENKCFCGEIEDMLHIYNCEFFNSKQQKLPFEKIFSGNMKHQIEVYRSFEENLEKREKIKTDDKPPCDPPVIRCSPADYSNG